MYNLLFLLINFYIILFVRNQNLSIHWNTCDTIILIEKNTNTIRFRVQFHGRVKYQLLHLELCSKNRKIIETNRYWKQCIKMQVSLRCWKIRLAFHEHVILLGCSRSISFTASSTGLPTKCGHDLMSNGASLNSSLISHTNTFCSLIVRTQNDRTKRLIPITLSVFFPMRWRACKWIAQKFSH